MEAVETELQYQNDTKEQPFGVIAFLVKLRFGWREIPDKDKSISLSTSGFSVSLQNCGYFPNSLKLEFLDTIGDLLLTSVIATTSKNRFRNHDCC
jgi:hypothetical protein